MKRFALILVLNSIVAILAFSEEVVKVEAGKVTINGDLEVTGNYEIQGLIEDVMGAFFPTGSIIAFGGDADSVPDGWLLCDGRTLSEADYSELHAVIGYSFGSSGSSFKVPDLRGVFPRGAGVHGTMEDSEGNNYDGGDVGTEKLDQLEDHRHGTYTYRNGIQQSIRRYSTRQDSQQHGTLYLESASLGVVGYVDEDDARKGDETQPASVSVNYIIKY